MAGREVRGLLVMVRDLAILPLEIEPCGHAFTFQVAGRGLRLCGKTLVLSESVGEFARGLFVLGGTPFHAECAPGNCVAVRAAPHPARTLR
jgi:hypothetical protein